MKSRYSVFTRIGSFILLFVFLLQPQFNVFAAANLTITPITWNVVGLDSNNVTTGPNNFPVGVRVCNTGDTPATNVSANFVWDSANALINLRPGSLNPILIPSLSHLAPNNCYDFYFEVEVTRNAAAYYTTRRYHIDVTADGGISVSTPTPREVYVERLVSQNRNSTLDVKLDGISVAPGGTMALVVGQTYTITLVGKTATNGYEQIESFINFPNTIFQVLGVNTTYTAESSAAMVPPYNTLYGDACVWENDPNSPKYRSCLSTGKAGGNITVEYTVRIIGGAGSTNILNTLIYDFSGASYHYNSDYSVGGRIAVIVDPTLVTISKNFNPDPTNVGGTSVLTFTLTNPNGAPVSDVSFTDNLPNTPGVMAVASTPNASTSGCGAPTFAPTAGTSTLTFSNGTIAANGTCTISVNVTVPATGVYNNTSNNLFVGTVDTGKTASDSLTVNTTPPAPACVAGLSIAQWTFPVGFNVNSPAPSSGSGSASPGAGVNPLSFTAGANSWGSDGGIATGATLVTANNDYFEYAINTAGYSSVDFTFDARRGTATNSPVGVAVYYGSSAGNPETGTLLYSNSNVLTTTLTNIGGTHTFTPPSGTTYVRIYFFNAGNANSSSDGMMDNVTFTGCGTPQYPTLTKSFSPDPVAVGGTSTLTFTVTNPNASVALSGLAFTDSLPAGVTVATSGPTVVCGGSLSTTAPSTITFTGGSLAASASCNIPIPVTVTTAGPHTNISGFVSSTQSGTNTTPTGYATDTITAILPPTISKLFAPNPILAGGVSTLTFVIENPNNDQPLSGVAFTDTFPVGMVVANPTGASTSGCGAPVFAPTIGVGSISFSGGLIAADGTCTVTVDVTVPTTGNYVNTSGAVTTIINGSPVGTDTASDTLDVEAPNPAIVLLKQVSTNPTGPWFQFISVTPGSDVYYQFTVENTGDVPLSPVSLTDNTLGISSCNTAWSSLTLQVADANDDDHIATCIVGPVTAVTGTNTNTATATGRYSGTPYTSTDSAATYATPELTLTKSATEAYFAAVSDTINYSYLVENTGDVPLLEPVTVADDKTTVTCPAVNTVGDLDNYLDPGESLTCTATYTIVAGDVTAGFVTNIAEASAGGVDSNEDDVTVPRQLPDLTVTKTNNTNNTSNSGTVGVAFNWILTVNNTGPLAATFADGQTLLSDPLPAGATYGSPTPGGFTGVTNSGNISCSIVLNNLTCTASGADVTIGTTTGSFTVTIPVTPTAGGNLANTATVDPDALINESDESNNTSTNTITVYAPPTVTKSFGAASINSGGNTTLTLTLTNPNTNPGALTTVRVDDTFPAGLTLQNTTFTFTPAACGTVTNTSGGASVAGDNNIRFTAASLAVGASCEVVVNVTSSTPGNIINTTGNVTATGPVALTGTSANDDLFINNPSLNIVKEVSDDNSAWEDITVTVNVGDTVYYQVTVTNTGNIDLNNPVVTDDQCTLSAPTGDTGNDGILGVNEVWVYTCSVTALAGSNDNTASASSDETPTPVTDDANYFGNDPSIQVDKTLFSATFTNPNTLRVTYLIDVANTGNVVLTNIQITDDLVTAFPGAVSFSVFTHFSSGSTPLTINNAFNGDADQNLLTGTNTLQVGESGQITLIVDVDTGGDEDTYINTADGTGTPPTGPDVTDDGVAGAPSFVDPALAKSANPLQASVGEVVVFTITVTNNGNLPAQNVVVVDPLPAQFDVTAVNVTGAPAGTVTTVTPPIGGSAPFTVTVEIGGAGGFLAVTDVVVIQITTVVNSLGQPPIVNAATLSTTDETDNLLNNAANVPLTILSPSTGGAIPALPETGFAPNIITRLPAQPDELAYSATDVILEIPSLKIKMPIVGVPLTKNGWDVTWLANQAGWLEGSAFPSWNGNSVLTSHVTLANGLTGPFANLSKLKYGDQVIVHANGQKFTFEIRTNATVAPTSKTYFRSEKLPWLTLITCKEYDEASGTYKKRIVVRAVLIEVVDEK